jgi:hypothetical protein
MRTTLSLDDDVAAKLTLSGRLTPAFMAVFCFGVASGSSLDASLIAPARSQA